MTPKIASTFFYFLLMLLFSISTVGQKPFCTQDPIPNTQTDLRTDPKYDLDACPADDIVIIGASLEKIGDPCNSCIAGTQITASLKITIHHKTESGNRFLGVFADLKQTAPNGTESICRIARCAGAVKKASEEGPSEQQVLDLGLVTFNCGNALELNRILTAWTAANGACPITSDGNSNPTGKYCYKLSTFIPITPPFNATLTAACGFGNKEILTSL